MSLTRNSLLILPLEPSEAFSTHGDQLAKLIGASELLYAAVALFSFDDSGAGEAIIDANGLLEEDILWWLDDVLSSHCNLFEHVRTFHNGQELDEVVFDPEEEALYISSKARPMLRRRSRLTRIQRVLHGHVGSSDGQHGPASDDAFFS